MKILLYSITFLMAFCSLTYEFIIATSLSHALGEGIYIYPACLGMFVFSMALGNLICLKLKDKLFLFWVEIALVLLGSVSVFLIKFSQIITPWGAVLNGFWFSLLIGVFTGMELPLLFELAGEKYGQGKTIRKIILMDYLASLFASLLFALFFAPLLGPLRTAVMVAFLNFIILILLVFLLRKELSVKWVLGFVIFFPFYFITIFYNLEKIENKLISLNFAISKNDVLLKKFYTPYQEVLLFLGKGNGFDKFKPEKEKIKLKPSEYYLYAYLNGQIQFKNSLGVQTDGYHFQMVDPFIKNLPNIEKVLILGGGDGLPAREVLRHKSIKSIQMVDLDGEWVDFTKDNFYLRLNTRDALRDPRIKIKYMDAFKWVAKSKEKFDAIFIDFPEGDNLAYVRTLSIQFFNDLKRILKDRGVIVLQNDGDLYPRVPPSTYLTIEKAGLFPLFAMGYGPYTGETIIHFAIFKSKALRSQYLKSYTDIYLKDPKNAFSFARYSFPYYLAEGEAPPGKGKVISFYDPFVIGFTWEELFSEYPFPKAAKWAKVPDDKPKIEPIWKQIRHFENNLLGY